jgi:hypothetical protein
VAAVDPTRAAFRFLLHSRECDELGAFTSAVPNWTSGDTFTLGDGRRFRIAKFVPFAGRASRYDGMMMVDVLDAAPQHEFDREA